MAITIVPFTPVTNANFQFFPELDGVTYTAIITWNAFGLRYYITLITNQTDVILFYSNSIYVVLCNKICERRGG